MGAVRMEALAGLMEELKDTQEQNALQYLIEIISVIEQLGAPLGLSVYFAVDEDGDEVRNTEAVS